MHLCIIYFCLIRGGSVGSLGGLHWGSICSVTELKTVYLLWVTGCHGCDTCGDQGENCVYSCLPSTPSTPPVPIQVSCVATRERTESTAVYLVHLALPGTCLTTCPYTGYLSGSCPVRFTGRTETGGPEAVRLIWDFCVWSQMIIYCWFIFEHSSVRIIK